MEIVHIKNPDFEVIKKIVEIEQEAFEGAGNVDLWIIKALIRYGLVFVIKETVAPENEIAINLYKKHGYAQEKLLEDEYGKGIHRYVMRKKLF